VSANAAKIRPDVALLNFRGSLAGPSAPQRYLLRAVGAGAITVSAPAHFQVSLSESVGYGASLVVPAPTGPILQPTPIYVRYMPGAAGNHTGDVTHADLGAPTISIAPVQVSGAVMDGYIQPSVLEMKFSSQVNQPSAVQAFSVFGHGLTAPISATVAPPFEISLSAASGFGPAVITAAPVAGYVAPVTFHVRYNPAAGISHGGEVTLASGTVGIVKLTLTGGVPGPSSLLSTALLNFTTHGLGVPSAEQSYTYSAVDVSGPVTVTAPPHFEVSLTSGSGFGPSVMTPAPVDGILWPLSVFVRYIPTAGLAHVGMIDHAGGVSLASLPVAGTVLIPTVQAAATVVQFATPAVSTPSGPQSYGVSGFNLLSEITVAVPAPFEVSLSAAGPWGPVVQSTAPAAGVIAAFDVFVRYNPQTGTGHSGDAGHASLNAATVHVALMGDVVPPPQLSASVAVLAFATQAVGAVSAEQSYDVSGSFLLGPVTIVAVAPFEVSLAGGTGFGPQVILTPVAGVLPLTPVFVRYAPQNAGSHNAALQHSTPAHAAVSVALSGVVNLPPPPAMQVSASALMFEAAPGAASPAQSYTVSGANMLAAVTITAPPDFEVSLAADSGYAASISTSPPTAGALAAAVYVRYNPTGGASHNGALSHLSPGATPVYIAVEGRVVTPPRHAGSADGNGCAAGSGALWPLVLGFLWRRRRRGQDLRG
jgi:hypothetical protein